MAKSRGIVILYEDLTEKWAEWAKKARLTNIGIHKIAVSGAGTVTGIDSLIGELNRTDGRKIIERLNDIGIETEYELHSLSWLLPRDLIEKDKSMFRMNDEGVRVNDKGFCPSSASAREIIAENSYRLAAILKQSSHNYFLWPDDANDCGCQCEKCREKRLNGADTGMIFSNAVAEGLKAYDSQACEAYIAYADAKIVPRIKPNDNVFLEFAPMDRDHDKPMNAQTDERGVEYIRLLEALLGIFPTETTHVLEYWFDNALYSQFKKPPVKIPFNASVMNEDAKMYTSYGIQNIKSFGSYIDDEYYALYGNPPIREYGDILAKYINVQEDDYVL